MFLVFLLNWNIVGVFGQSNNFLITDFGALADGITDNKEVNLEIDDMSYYHAHYA